MSVAELAERAGMSERTVYRHFPTRVDLLAAAGAWINDNVFNYIEHVSIDDLPEVFRRVCRRFDEQPELAYAIARSRLGHSMRIGFRAEVLKHNRESIDELANHLTERERRQVAAIVAHLDNVLTWSTMREELGMDGDEMADTVEWVLSLVLDDVRKRNQEAAMEQKAAQSK